ncbi:MAG: hypothetical protein P4L61_03095 [Candidatus Pacebacteria bacterium]|nr:hypothetical protein [Candidatus Paceibacterota bacterium]
MNTKELVTYLEKKFKPEKKKRQRQILGQLQIMINDSGIKTCSGQELIICQSIERIAETTSSNIETQLILMLALATYINSCRNN